MKNLSVTVSSANSALSCVEVGEMLQSAWKEVFPTSRISLRMYLPRSLKALAPTDPQAADADSIIVAFYLSHDNAELPSQILQNDILHYTMEYRDGVLKENDLSWYHKPTKQFMALGSTKLRKQTFKTISKANLLKRFKALHAALVETMTEPGYTDSQMAYVPKRLGVK